MYYVTLPIPPIKSTNDKAPALLSSQIEAIPTPMTTTHFMSPFIQKLIFGGHFDPSIVSKEKGILAHDHFIFTVVDVMVLNGAWHNDKELTMA